MPVMKKNHYKQWKIKEIQDVESFLASYDMLAVADIKGLPANALRDFREALRKNNFKVRVSKLRLIKKSLQKLGMPDLDNYCEGNVAVIGGNSSPFGMFSTIKKNASSSGAKAGMIAPDDIVVPEGDTGIAPGPALSDFKAVKIDTQIRAGKIFVPKPTTVAKKGEEITSKVVSILGKLNIKPIKVLLKVKGAYTKSDKIMYDAQVLDINLDQFKTDVMVAYQNAIALALSQAYITNETMKPLVVKAYRSAKGVAVQNGIVNSDTIKDILGKAHRVSSNINSKVN